MVAQIDSQYLRTRPWKLWGRMISYCLFEGRPLTTRGRWINPLVFGHFAVEKRLPPIMKVKQPVFILGTGRSGTTILGVVLSMHREVGFLNEPKALWHAIYSEEDLIGSYSSGPARYRLTEKDAKSEVSRTAHRLFGIYQAATFSRRVVDKYPELIFRVPFVKAIFPDAKFLFLVRNGWDTCHSIERWSQRLGQKGNDEVHDWWGVDRRKWNLLVKQLVPEHSDLAHHADSMRGWTNHIDMAALEWILTMREGIALMEQYPTDIMRVTFETLCSEPRVVLERITEFLGLALPDEPFFRYGVGILQPVAAKKPLILDSDIAPAFVQTMQNLGYEG